MTKKRIFIVIAFLALIALAIYGWQKQQEFAYVQSNQLLVDNLATRVNDIVSVEIISSEAKLTLEKNKNQWLLREQDSYPVDITKVRSLLLQLAESTLLEEKTANSELYPKLGLDEQTRVSLSAYMDTEKTKPIFSLAIGDTSGSIGTYVLLDDDAQSWLTSGEIRLVTKAGDWLQTELLNLDPKDIARISIQHSEKGQALALIANEDGTDFVLDNVPKGMEADLTKTHSITTAFRNLTLEEVRNESAKEASDGVTSELITRDGMVVTTLVFQDQEQYWAKFAIEASIENVIIPEDNTTDTAENVLVRTQAKIDKIAPRLASRWFRISASVGQALSYKKDDIINDKDKQE